MKNELTIKQVEEKFGGVGVYFTSYYKYSFTFRGQLTIPLGAAGQPTTYRILVAYGGASDDIYRYSVDNVEPKTFGKVLDWNFVQITRVDAEDHKLVFEHYES